jgi:hypothetical protein
VDDTVVVLQAPHAKKEAGQKRCWCCCYLSDAEEKKQVKIQLTPHGIQFKVSRLLVCPMELTTISCKINRYFCLKRSIIKGQNFSNIKGYSLDSTMVQTLFSFKKN